MYVNSSQEIHDFHIFAHIREEKYSQVLQSVGRVEFAESSYEKLKANSKLKFVTWELASSLFYSLKKPLTFAAIGVCRKHFFSSNQYEIIFLLRVVGKMKIAVMSVICSWHRNYVPTNLLVPEMIDRKLECQMGTIYRCLGCGFCSVHIQKQTSNKDKNAIC